MAKTGEEVRARFTVPSTNADKSTPADLVAVEVYAISGKPEDPLGNSLAGPQFIRFGELVGRVQVAPPETPGEEPPDPTHGSVAERARAAAELAARQAQPAQGSAVTVIEHLTPADYTPFVHPDRRRHRRRCRATTVLVRPLGPPPPEDPFSRTYIAIGVSRHGTRSAVSNRVAVPLADTPGPPSAVTVVHAETSATVQWTAPPGTFRRAQRPAKPDEIPARSLAPAVVPTTYNVYRVPRTGGSGAAPPAPVNTIAIEGTGFTQNPITLGEEGCYQVRAVRVYGNARLESAPSETACTMFVDTFPPPPPTNLAAVGSEGGVSLIWDPSTGSRRRRVSGPPRRDWRGRPAGGARPAHGAADSREHYRDDTARRGARYVYAVVAIDGATPPNRSVESNRVEEGAR